MDLRSQFRDHCVHKYEGVNTLDSLDDLLYLDVDILVPCARPDVISQLNVDQVQAKLILQGANIPIALAILIPIQVFVFCFFAFNPWIQIPKSVIVIFMITLAVEYMQRIHTQI